MYRKRFLILKGYKYFVLHTSDVAFLKYETGTLYAVGFDSSRYRIKGVLCEIEKELDSYSFFRVSRQMIVNVEAIEFCEDYFNGKLILHLKHNLSNRIVISRVRAPLFKKWIDS